MTIRVLIADDEALVRESLQAALGRHSDLAVVGTCSDGPATITSVRRLQPDLLFLDVQMPGGDGFAVLRALPLELRPVVIFVTAYDHYALDAFEVHAIDYLLKPFDDERVDVALQRARLLLAGRAANNVPAALTTLLEQLGPRPDHLRRVAVATTRGVTLVDVTEIAWIQAAGNYVRLHCEGGQHLLRESLSQLADRLDPTRFLRIHRSAIVNLGCVQEIEFPRPGIPIFVLRDGARIRASEAGWERFERVVGKPR